MKKVKVFDREQRMMGADPVCTCCNLKLNGAEKRTVVDGHALHMECADKLQIVVAIKADLQPVIETLPAELFKGSNLLERLSSAYTVSMFKGVWYDLCSRIKGMKQLLADEFAGIVESLQKIAEGSKISAVLVPVMNF